MPIDSLDSQYAVTSYSCPEYGFNLVATERTCSSVNVRSAIAAFNLGRQLRFVTGELPAVGFQRLHVGRNLLSRGMQAGLDHLGCFQIVAIHGNGFATTRPCSSDVPSTFNLSPGISTTLE